MRAETLESLLSASGGESDPKQGRPRRAYVTSCAASPSHAQRVTLRRPLILPPAHSSILDPLPERLWVMAANAS